MKRGAALAAWIAIVTLFTLPRLYLVFRRDPDVDELFTVWLVRKDFSSIFATLRLDSGPPLYYALVKALPAGWKNVTSVRMLSIVAAVAALVIVMRAAGAFPAALAAGALLALYPHHLFFSSVARAYALTALLIGAAAVLCDRWAERGDRRALVMACLSILAAAYSHYYGVYFFPLPFVVALATSRSRWREGFVASFLLGIAFIPGFLLMKIQPGHAIAWMRIDDPVLRIWMVAQAVLRAGFDGRQPLPFGMTAFRAVSGALFVGALIATAKSPRAKRYLLAIVVPIGGALFAAGMGMTAYFPIRFESVLSVPVVLWFWFAADAAGGRRKAILIAAAGVVGAIAAASLLTRDWRNTSPVYRAALYARDRVPAEVPIVATGHAYLEAAALTERRIIAFPALHAVHLDDVTESELRQEAARLPSAFLWIGDTTNPPFRVLRSKYAMQPVAQFGQVVVARCLPRNARRSRPAER